MTTSRLATVRALAYRDDRTAAWTEPDTSAVLIPIPVASTEKSFLVRVLFKDATHTAFVVRAANMRAAKLQAETMYPEAVMMFVA